ncbi:putative Fe-Mo cluster-binding NifX family protein [Halanaerobium saccharolyticum]|jgi:predicted Fe-Mo cluster-binding NifX family protein|uniref:Putative Fe-Mo cluster-binding NifX family protein n=1 Tax=Halanaerobium saccharolyticum TaxID=43595 RepID=A0A2T5RHA3_9FIRM|nr:MULTISPECIES: NifB/NifX family molybdenum-iron cluster-binding protein [Halanaerobium]PTV95350.1 putative Fe-Mo cluster-binding NifX family protein [Halanaerobium saccharolyticum]PUU91118.1 MAG: dinitrogenase iron-molybdenum cofactor biosynthesis protein [Halanaerobium sp.]TDQ00022.1 putative Fe-Mo cluster-binding NifX family protein [Halanaerobium saccharolyticum]
MKKIAVPVQGENVSAHFGHAPEFKLFSTEDNTISAEEVIENPGHQPGLLPKLLNEAGADIIIASGMGQKAIAIFEHNNIEVVCGAAGNAREAVSNYLNDKLDASDNACSHGEGDGHHDHDHHGHGGHGHHH